MLGILRGTTMQDLGEEMARLLYMLGGALALVTVMGATCGLYTMGIQMDHEACHQHPTAQCLSRMPAVVQDIPQAARPSRSPDERP